MGAKKNSAHNEKKPPPPAQRKLHKKRKNAFYMKKVSPSPQEGEKGPTNRLFSRGTRQALTLAASLRTPMSECDYKIHNIYSTLIYIKIHSRMHPIELFKKNSRTSCTQQFGSLSNAYFDIQEQSCGDFNTASSDLTITVRAAFTQTFHMTSNGTIEIEVPNVSILIALEKHDACSTLIFK